MSNVPFTNPKYCSTSLLIVTNGTSDMIIFGVPSSFVRSTAKEVSAYIYRENIILTIIGTVVGLGLGTILHKFIMVTVEIQSMMFGRVIDMSSYFIAAVLTIVLSLFVNLAMFYKLRNVKMVESLKSVD